MALHEVKDGSPEIGRDVSGSAASVALAVVVFETIVTRLSGPIAVPATVFEFEGDIKSGHWSFSLSEALAISAKVSAHECMMSAMSLLWACC
jgi:hypothetical protein